jgi:hypothetical protein
MDAQSMGILAQSALLRMLDATAIDCFVPSISPSAELRDCFRTSWTWLTDRDESLTTTELSADALIE